MLASASGKQSSEGLGFFLEDVLKVPTVVRKVEHSRHYTYDDIRLSLRFSQALFHCSITSGSGEGNPP